MHHFESNSEIRPARPARHHHRAKLSGTEAAARQTRQARQRPGQPGGRNGPVVNLGSQEDLAQPVGRAHRRPAGQPAGSRNLPGLMRRQSDGDGTRLPSGSGRSLPSLLVPSARSALDGQSSPINGHALSPGLAGEAAESRGQRAGRASTDRAFRAITDGMAIAPKVTVVLPVMNEAANLPGVFGTLPVWVNEVVLVDGRSTDDTIDVARSLRSDVKVVHQGGVGKGDALAAGFAAATGDIIVAIDGDGSTDGKEIVRFVSALLAGADFAKGSRFSSAGRSDDITVIRRYGNKALNLTVNRLFGTSFTDLCYGYNAFWSKHLEKLALDSPGFEIETLMSIRAAEAGLNIYEVPSHERLRQHGASNLSAVKDGWRILRLIVAEKRDARRRKVRKPRPFMAPGLLADDLGPDQVECDPVRNASGSNGVRFNGLGPNSDGQGRQ
jgi:hypothetical protein